MIKNTFSIFITLLILSASTWADDQLSCSANGLKIIYVNGVRVDKKGNDESVENIQTLVDPVNPVILDTILASIKLTLHNQNQVLL